MFGAGKTTFLKNFFHDRKDQFLSIHLFPTNYIANKNEDVFELIKFDILYELLSKDPKLENIELEFSQGVALLLKQDPSKVLLPLIECVPKIGKNIGSILNAMAKLKNEILKKIQKNSDNEGQSIKSLVTEVTETEGHVYENDIYTDLIKKLLRRAAGDKRKIALIVDDIDRIDPDNIFRLLNVFSVHLDVVAEGDNKFDFDRIIFVCDVSNIRDVFRAKFGQAANFSGYVDKFYSTNIYNFDNRNAILKSVAGILASIKPSKGQLWSKESTFRDSVMFGCLSYTLECMIQSKAFSLRQLVKLRDFDYRERVHSYLDSTFNRIYIVPLFELLLTIFDGADELSRAVSKTKFIFFEGDNDAGENLVANCLIVFNRLNSGRDFAVGFGSYTIHIDVSEVPINRSIKVLARVPPGQTLDRSINIGDIVKTTTEYFLAQKLE